MSGVREVVGEEMEEMRIRFERWEEKVPTGVLACNEGE